MTAASTEARAPAARKRGHHAEIFLICFASLLIEISYTRIISFKLFYYYTYLVIGLALLGIGTGSVLTSMSARVKRASTDAILIAGCLLGALSVVVSYLVVARIPIASLNVWSYGTRSSVSNLASMVIICLALFASFVAIGVMISTLFGRNSEGIGKLYFADLVGAGLACAIVVPLLGTLGPPRIIALAAAILAVAAIVVAVKAGARPAVPVGAVMAAGLAVLVAAPRLLPDVRPDTNKTLHDIPNTEHSGWSPIFRVDVAESGDMKTLYHDGMTGSLIRKWDGKVESLAGPPFNFDQDTRSIPFDVLGQSPEKVMIIGAAGGHEVLASLNYRAGQIDAIELNPHTYELVTGEYADYAGRLAEHPGVNYRNGDGRTFLAQSGDRYELIWYPAPDSYAATNAASAGAFVLSESYLYTSETVKESLDHLTDDGIIATQFGEINFDEKPNRTTRYVATVREALEQSGVADPGRHVLVSTAHGGITATFSTVLVKRTPFTDEEVRAFTGQSSSIEGYGVQYAPGQPQDNAITKVLTLPAAQQQAFLASYPFAVDAISDDGPFFWHFARFGDVISMYGEPIDRWDTEDSLGERVLLLLLVLATVLAAIFLLAPFVTMRRIWRELPRKPTSAVYFSALGLGFMFFEITLIQRLVLFLGYPTYSLTVTLASLLIFTGVGALLSRRLRGDIGRSTALLAPLVIVLGLAYLFGLPLLTEALLTTPLGVRVLVAFVVLAPLGTMLGLFMPLGLGVVSGLTKHSGEYVAWSWAVNGFASVIGSVLSTLIAMVAGFNVVLGLSMGVYLVALVSLRRLNQPLPGGATAAPADREDVPASDTPVPVAGGNGSAPASPVPAATS